MDLIILTHTFATLFMVGVIWLVQIVHYPLYHHIHPQSFPDYEVQHVNKITLVVAPVMFIEATTALLLVVRAPSSIPLWARLLGLALVIVIWVATLALNVPQHNQLSYQFEPTTLNQMIASNWIRTLAWSARGALVLWMMGNLIGGQL
ncbi:MAG: hypothetical protein ACOYLB_05465 [Phototrophicaceae bacterium]